MVMVDSSQIVDDTIRKLRELVGQAYLHSDVRLWKDEAEFKELFDTLERELADERKYAHEFCDMGEDL